MRTDRPDPRTPTERHRDTCRDYCQRRAEFLSALLDVRDRVAGRSGVHMAVATLNEAVRRAAFAVDRSVRRWIDADREVSGERAAKRGEAA